MMLPNLNDNMSSYVPQDYAHGTMTPACFCVVSVMDRHFSHYFKTALHR